MTAVPVGVQPVPFSVLDLSPIRLERPYVMLGVNVFAADTDVEARRLFSSLLQAFVNLRTGRPGPLPPPDESYETELTPMAQVAISEMLSCTVIGSRETVRRGLSAFIASTEADELMVTSQIFDHAARLRSYEIAAEVRAAL